MRCIVTGGAGFIGSNLVDRLIDNGHEVIVFDNLSTGREENINPKAKFFKVDANVNGLVNILEMCREHNIKRFIFSSSSSVYGDVEEKDLPTSESKKLNPMSPYALHKLIGEQYCKLYSELYGIETVSLRYFNVYGHRQPTSGAYCLVMGIFAGQRLNGEPMTIRGDGEQRRDFTYVGDVVDANVRCMDYPLELNGDSFNIGNGDNRSVNEIADLIGGDRINVEPVIEPKVTLADNKEAKRILQWNPKGNLEKWIVEWKKDICLK
mgnify:CR=1 FL=1